MALVRLQRIRQPFISLHTALKFNVQGLVTQTVLRLLRLDLLAVVAIARTRLVVGQLNGEALFLDGQTHHTVIAVGFTVGSADGLERSVASVTMVLLTAGLENKPKKSRVGTLLKNYSTISYILWENAVCSWAGSLVSLHFVTMLCREPFKHTHVRSRYACKEKNARVAHGDQIETGSQMIPLPVHQIRSNLGSLIRAMHCVP